MEKLSLKELNKKLPDSRILHDILVDNKGYYLPKRSSKACTIPYSMRIVKDPKVLKPFRKQITKVPYVKQNKTVEELVDIANDLLKKRWFNTRILPRYKTWQRMDHWCPVFSLPQTSNIQSWRSNIGKRIPKRVFF